jgi:hypothetical protein
MPKSNEVYKWLRIGTIACFSLACLHILVMCLSQPLVPNFWIAINIVPSIVEKNARNVFIYLSLSFILLLIRFVLEQFVDNKNCEDMARNGKSDSFNYPSNESSSIGSKRGVTKPKYTSTSAKNRHKKKKRKKSK